SQYQDLILQRVATVIPVESLIWVPPDADEIVSILGNRCLSAGECSELARFLAKEPGWDPLGCLILNEVPSCGLGARFPRIQNLMALPVGERETGGWLIALNKGAATALADRSPGRDGHATRVQQPATLPDRAVEDRRAIVPFRRIDAALLRPF